MSFGLIIFGVATAFSSSVWVFICLRFCVAFFTISVFTTAYVYCKKNIETAQYYVLLTSKLL